MRSIIVRPPSKPMSGIERIRRTLPSPFDVAMDILSATWSESDANSSRVQNGTITLLSSIDETKLTTQTTASQLITTRI